MAQRYSLTGGRLFNLFRNLITARCDELLLESNGLERTRGARAVDDINSEGVTAAASDIAMNVQDPTRSAAIDDNGGASGETLLSPSSRRAPNRDSGLGSATTVRVHQRRQSSTEVQIEVGDSITRPSFQPLMSLQDIIATANGQANPLNESAYEHTSAAERSNGRQRPRAGDDQEYHGSVRPSSTPEVDRLSESTARSTDHSVGPGT